MVILFHVTSAIILFFIVNIIGKYAPTNLGYYQISTFSQTDDAPAFNFLFRILTPVVFIILLSALLYYFNLDQLVKNIYLISIYYVMFRALFNLITSRTYLVNWKKQFLYAISTVVITYLMYDKLISKKENLLPDFSNIANELWIIILLFLYSLINKIENPADGAEKRKLLYMKKSLNTLEKNYSQLINSQILNTRLKHIVYSIIIHENFNRPKIVRAVETLKLLVTNKELTLGIMQVKSDKKISDLESVQMGIEILLKKLENLDKEFQTEYHKTKKANDIDDKHLLFYLDREYQTRLVYAYNHCDNYSNQIISLSDYLNEKFYANLEENRNLFVIKKHNT